MGNTEPKRDPTRIGRGKPGPGRPSRAQEFGLSELLNEAWPRAERIKALKEIATLVTTARAEKVRVLAAELLLKYAYGTPKPIDVACPVDLNADIDKMTPEEREIHALKLQQYALAKGIQL
jgi:hypothetical protein